MVHGSHSMFLDSCTVCMNESFFYFLILSISLEVTRILWSKFYFDTFNSIPSTTSFKNRLNCNCTPLLRVSGYLFPLTVNESSQKKSYTFMIIQVIIKENKS
jgi:hypothetical protein